MTPEQATRLRESFPAEQVGLLPRITCKDCSDAPSRCCAEHRKAKCDACGNYITERHMHIDYVGHGAVTDRLLEVDPEWTWDPVAVDDQGQPLFRYDQRGNPVGFWMTVTVGGVTRRGYGSCPSNQTDAEKVLIGDALRNAAMRYGVALDLWIKGHAEDDLSVTDGRGAGQAAHRQSATLTAAAAKGRLLADAGGDKDAAAEAWDKAGLKGRGSVTDADLERAVAELHQLGWSWARPDGENVAGGAADREAADGPPGTDDAPPAPSTVPAGGGGAGAPAAGRRALNARDVARRATEVFRPAYDAAPRGDKTRTVERLRHALTWACTGGRATSLNDLDGAGLAAVMARLEEIAAGKIIYRHDGKGVRWISPHDAVAVQWADIEPAPNGETAA
jgi:hypothetical protein